MVDQLADALAGQRGATAPVLPALTPTAALRAWPETVPAAPSEDPARTLQAVVARAITGSVQLHHPGFVGHQVATPLPTAAVVDLAASLLNNGMAIYEMGPSGSALEQKVLTWLARRLHLPVTAAGVLTSGGSLGNLTALLAARQARGDDPWRRGVRSQPLVIFVAETAHYSVARACRILGLGDEGCVSVPVDDQLRLDVGALQAAIATARKKKKRPIAVVASAGSTAAGAIDPLDAVADVCAAEGLWFHVDGAHGGPLALLPERADDLHGLQRADSVVVDFHKLLGMPALATAVLFADGKTGAQAFAQEAGYLFPELDTAAVNDESWADIGRRTVECTKRPIGLKIWACLQAYGEDFFADHVRHCCALAQHLAAGVDARPALELLVRPEANIVCFRVRGRDGGVNAAIRQQLVDDGRFYPVQVHLHARGLAPERRGLWLRCALQSPHTTPAVLDALLDAVVAAIPPAP